jgi:ABC-type nitrate/sulfonate/bicarbonate transport system ATPase subunit
MGLARRTAIARAFAARPDFLLLDEPFVSIDEAVAARLRNELVAVTMRTKVTTLFVTHDLAEAIQLADRLFFLSDRPARIIVESHCRRRGEHAAETSLHQSAMTCVY